MMPFPALPFALPSLPWKWLGVGLTAVVAVAAVFFAVRGFGNARYHEGVLEERAIWEKLVAEQNAQLAELQRLADNNLAAQREHDRTAIAQTREELDNALADIPDQTTTDRQRRIACFELRRAGQAPAACDADPAP